MTPAQAIVAATRNGAIASRGIAQFGTIERGKRADLLIVSTDAARQVPMFDPVSHLVYVTRGDDVRTTIVHGRVLMRDGRVQTLNEAAVVKEAREWAVKVRAAVQ